MRTSIVRRALALGSVALCLSAAAVPAAAQFGSNLITNGNAEAGLGSPSGNDVVAVPGWTTTGNFTVVQYTAGGGFPGPTSPGPAVRGANFFAGGPDNAASSATQSLSFAGFAGLPGLVDGGGVGFTLSGYLGGFETQNDNATLTAEFLNAGATTIGSAAIGSVFAADRGGVTGLLSRSFAGVVPVGTRSVRFTLAMTRTDGAYNDGYADNLSFTLTSSVVPEPSSYALVAAGLAGVGAAARRRRRPTT